MISTGSVNESRRGFWLVPYYLTLGRLTGKRDAFLHQFAQLRKTKKEDRYKQGPHIELEPVKNLQNVLNDIAEDRHTASKARAIRDDVKHAWQRESSAQKTVQVATKLLERMKSDLSEAGELRALWFAQQDARRTWLKLEMQGSISLQIHFSARLLYDKVNSDSRFKCGLFRQFEPDKEAQEWHEKSSKVLSLAEASILESEATLLERWVEASIKLSKEEEKIRLAVPSKLGKGSLGKEEGWKQPDIRDYEGKDWWEIQRGLEGTERGLKDTGWGGYALGCTYYSSVTGFIDREFQRIGLRSRDLR